MFRRVQSKLSRMIKSRLPEPNRYEPYIPEQVNPKLLHQEIADILPLSKAEVGQLWEAYDQFSIEKDYLTTFGNQKTLAQEEAFILYLLMKHYTLPYVVEIGTQYGKSTRRILDIKAHLKQDTSVIAYDIDDQVKHFKPEEVDFRLQDITGRVDRMILDELGSGLIYLDAHPYHLLREVIQGVLKQDRWFLTIHDMSPYLCNPAISIGRDEPEKITSKTGHWERIVAAEIFNVADPKSPALDYIETDTHIWRIFSTRHGLALLMPKQMLSKAE